MTKVLTMRVSTSYLTLLSQTCRRLHIELPIELQTHVRHCRTMSSFRAFFHVAFHFACLSRVHPGLLRLLACLAQKKEASPLKTFERARGGSCRPFALAKVLLESLKNSARGTLHDGQVARRSNHSLTHSLTHSLKISIVKLR